MPDLTPAPNLLTLIQNDGIFAQSDAESLARLLPKINQRLLAAGEPLYTLGDHADYFYWIASGSLILTTAKGKQWVATERCGEEAASDIHAYMTNAIAQEATQVYQVPRQALLEFLKANASLKMDLVLSLTQHLSGEVLEKRPSETKSLVVGYRFKTILGWLLALITPIIFLLNSDAFGLSPSADLFMAIFSATVIMWLFSLVDDYIPGLFALLAILVTGLVPAPVILSGFASDGFMMALSTLAFGTVVVSSGLSYRVMLNLLYRLPNSQFWHNSALYILGVALTPIIPTANGRIALVSPFYSDTVSSVQYQSNGRASTRLAVSCFSGVSLFSAVFLTSKSVNFAVFSLLSPQGQDHFQWLTWCFTGLVAGAVLLAINALCGFVFFYNHEKPQLTKACVQDQLAVLGPIKPREWAAIVGGLFLTLGLVTSSIHKVQPPWLGFAVMFGLLLCGTLDKKELKEKVDWVFLLYLSGITGLVAAFSYLKLDSTLASAMPELGEYMHNNLYLFIFLLFVVVNLIRIAVPINATIVILASLLMPVADAAGINAWVVGFLILLFAESWFMPYQCSYYLPLQELNNKKRLYKEKNFLRFNAIMTCGRLLAAYASIPFWVALGVL